MSKGIVISSLLVLGCVFYAGITATVVRQGQEASLTGEVAFDPIAEANRFWSLKSKEYFQSNAVDLTALFEESGGDLKSVASKYGHYSMGDRGQLSFIVKGSGTITEVKNKLKSGYIRLAVDGLDRDVRLQIGPLHSSIPSFFKVSASFSLIRERRTPTATELIPTAPAIALTLSQPQ